MLEKSSSIWPTCKDQVSFLLLILLLLIIVIIIICFFIFILFSLLCRGKTLAFKEIPVKTLAERKQLQTTASNQNNSEEEEESDFQSYHVIIFNMSHFQQNIIKHAKKQENVSLHGRNLQKLSLRSHRHLVY